MAGGVQLVIGLTEDGRFHCTGPLENKLLCYGLLKLAEEAVAKHRASGLIQPAPVDVAAMLKS